MADANDPTGPATPEIPLFLKVDGDLSAIEFVRRLQRGGLKLLDDGDHRAVIVAGDCEPGRETTDAQRGHIEQQRRQLNKAVAVLIGAELSAEYCPDMSLVTDAIGVARELVEAAIEALDIVNLNRPNNLKGVQS